MNAIDLKTVNQKSPYRVFGSSEDDYYFLTRNGGYYKVGFIEDYSIWEKGAYQFYISRETDGKSATDTQLRDTIFAILEGFFQTNPGILLYVCDMMDGRQSARNRLFNRWFRQYKGKENYVFSSKELVSDGVSNFAAIIVPRQNPQSSQIIKDFEGLIKKIEDKPLKMADESE